MLISDFLTHSTRVSGDRPAVWFQNEWRSYLDLSTAAGSFAAFLVKNGVEPGERVAILLENSFDYIVAHFGALMTGVVEVSLNVDLKAGELDALLNDCGAVVFIAGRKQAREWASVVAGAPDLRFVVTDIAPDKLPQLPKGMPAYSLEDAVVSVAGGAELPLPSVGGGDLASIVYTSGSTGTPKGVQLTHTNLVSNTGAIVDYLGLRQSDRMMVVLPFHYIYGRSLLYTHFLSGGSIVIDNRFAYPSAILNTMEELEVTCFAGVPSTFSIISVSIP